MNRTEGMAFVPEVIQLRPHSSRTHSSFHRAMQSICCQQLIWFHFPAESLLSGQQWSDSHIRPTRRQVGRSRPVPVWRPRHPAYRVPGACDPSHDQQRQRVFDKPPPGLLRRLAVAQNARQVLELDASGGHIWGRHVWVLFEYRPRVKSITHTL